MFTTKCPTGLFDHRDSAINNDTKNQPLSTSERLNQLEKEVNALRSDFDRIKWEQTIVETVIGRAIIRGSASLGGCYELLCPQTTSIQGTKNLIPDNGRKNSIFNSKLNLIKNNMNLDKDDAPFPKQYEVKNNNDKLNCGNFTFG